MCFCKVWWSKLFLVKRNKMRHLMKYIQKSFKFRKCRLVAILSKETNNAPVGKPCRTYSLSAFGHLAKVKLLTLKSIS